MRARRTDENLLDIVLAAKACGLRVFVRNDELGDMDVQYGTISEVWECKTATGKLTPGQKNLRAMGWHIPIVRTPAEAVAAAKALRARAR